MKPLLLLALLLGFTACDKKPNSTTQAPAPKAADPAAPITEDRLGVKFYPGAKIVTSGETAEVVSANLRTPDAADVVRKFYEEQLSLAPSGKAGGMLVATRNNLKYAINIQSDAGVTNVSIMAKK